MFFTQFFQADTSLVLISHGMCPNSNSTWGSFASYCLTPGSSPFFWIKGMENRAKAIIRQNWFVVTHCRGFSDSRDAESLLYEGGGNWQKQIKLLLNGSLFRINRICKAEFQIYVHWFVYYKQYLSLCLYSTFYNIKIFMLINSWSLYSIELVHNVDVILKANFEWYLKYVFFNIPHVLFTAFS